MNIPRPRRHRLFAVLTLAALPAVAVSLAPVSSGQNPCDWDAGSWECLMYQTGQPAAGVPGAPAAAPPAAAPDAGWTQPGDLVIPAGGGPPQVAVAPAPPGAPVVTGGGGPPVVPAAPPIP